MKKIGTIILFSVAILSLLSSCEKTKSYAQQLTEERVATNLYLANYKVVNSIPKDSVFEEGENAPYYRIDPDGMVYMQVINSGDKKNNKAEDKDRIYFRYRRLNLINWSIDPEKTKEYGNADNMSYLSTYFMYNDYSTETSYQWGIGIQYPLEFLGVDCEVNLIIKSQYGFVDEISDVVPYRYNLRYYRSKI